MLSSWSRKRPPDWTGLQTKAVVSVTPEHPEADIHHVMRGVVRRGLKPQPPKAAISLLIEQDVLEWFKAQGPGYQTRINAVLRTSGTGGNLSTDTFLAVLARALDATLCSADNDFRRYHHLKYFNPVLES